MTSIPTAASHHTSETTPIWDSLKQAIATSSGFQRWQIEHPVEDKSQECSLDYRVRRYLRETLETLAY